MKKILLITLLASTLFTFAQTEDGLYAQMKTNKGDILLKLEYHCIIKVHLVNSVISICFISKFYILTYTCNSKVSVLAEFISRA